MYLIYASHDRTRAGSLGSANDNLHANYNTSQSTDNTKYIAADMWVSRGAGDFDGSVLEGFPNPRSQFGKLSPIFVGPLP